ncbi:MAG: FAD-dependent oxidoreductase [Actinomycetota bacterium]|nr:FAD-dependent oxidoreductase [Actinomycetota bacterium]
MPRAIHFEVFVERVERHSPGVASFHFAWRGRRPQFRPGQFVHVALDDYDPSLHWPESRVFSIASAPSDQNGMRLTISRQGRFTARLLEEVEPGRVLWCKGPYGQFEVSPRAPGKGVALVAGGTGITPFCAVMEEALLRPEVLTGPVHLYYGARTADLLVYRELVQRCAAELPCFETGLFSEEGQAPQGIEQGRLDIDRIARECGGDVTYFLSGPKPMIDAFSQTLRGIDLLPPDGVVVDAWE